MPPSRRCRKDFQTNAQASFLARHGKALRFAPLDGGTLFPVRAGTARPGWIADEHVGLYIIGAYLEEIPVMKIFPSENGKEPATLQQASYVRRTDLFEQSDVQREHRHPNRTAVDVPSVQSGEDAEQAVPADRPGRARLAPALAQALERPHQKHARAAGRVKETPGLLRRVGQGVPHLGDHGVGEEHRGVVGALRAALRVVLAQESVVDGADQLDGYVLEVVSPEPVLARTPMHLLASGTEAAEDVQMGRGQGRTVIVLLEGAWRNEEVPVEVFPQTLEETIQPVDGPGFHESRERACETIRSFQEILGEDDFPVLQPSDEHDLNEQCLRRIGGQTGVVAKQAVRRDEIAEKHMVDALTGSEILGMLLPQAAGFRAVDDVPEHQGVAHGVESRDEASVLEVVVLAGVRSARQRKGTYRISGDDEQEARETLVPEPGVQIDDRRPVVLVDREDRDGRRLLDTEDRGYAQLIERRAYGARVRGVSDVVRALVELGNLAGGEVQTILPLRSERLRSQGLHQVCSCASPLRRTAAVGACDSRAEGGSSPPRLSPG